VAEAARAPFDPPEEMKSSGSGCVMLSNRFVPASCASVLTPPAKSVIVRTRPLTYPKVVVRPVESVTVIVQLCRLVSSVMASA